MRDTPQPKSLDALFVEAKTAPATDHPQAKDSSAEDNQARPQPKDQPNAASTEDNGKSNESQAKEETAEEKLAKAEKRLKDTQEWGNKQRREALEAKKKLQESGLLDPEEETELAALAKEVEDPLTQAMSDFWARYTPVSEFLKATGENPDDAIEAFKLVANGNKPLMEEFVQLKPEERVPWVLNKGRENLTLYTAMKEHGSLDKAITAIRQKAEQEAIERLKQQAGVAAEPGRAQKPAPRLSGSNLPSGGEYSRKSLGELFK